LLQFFVFCSFCFFSIKIVGSMAASGLRRSPVNDGRVDTCHVNHLIPEEKSVLIEMQQVLNAWCADISSLGIVNDKGEIASEQFVRKFCDDYCLMRYARARSWIVEKASAMLLETLKWRWQIRPDLITAQQVKVQASAGSNYHNGFDKYGHPVFYMRASRDPPGSTQEKLDLLFYNMEEGVRRMNSETGVEKFVYIIDLKGFSITQSGADAKLSQSWLNALQNHYPERLSKVFVIDSGMMFTGFWNVISYFIDPESRRKMTFLTLDQFKKSIPTSDYFTVDTLEEYYGGTLPVKVTDAQHAKALAAMKNVPTTEVDEKKVAPKKSFFSLKK